MELADTLTYKAENYKFHPKYKARIWDGNICLVNRLNRQIYRGLAQRVKKFCDSRGYSFSFDDEFLYENVSQYEIEEFAKNLKLPFDPRDYQIDAVVKCIRSQRRTLLSPTSSGKSLIIYMLAQWYKKKTLVIVPTINLVNQLASDFIDYGFKGKFNLSTDGLCKELDIDADVVITTWQSLENGKRGMPAAWYDQFDVVFGDEAHGCKSTSLIKILSNMRNTKYRFGTTGTLDDNQLNQATIEGLFGPKYKTVSTSELMEQGSVSRLKIKCLVLKYPEEICKDMRGKTYQEEIDFIVNYEPRTTFIKNLALSLKGNKLVFFRMRDHGQTLYTAMKAGTDSPIFYIDGNIDGTAREEIRHAIEDQEESILIASLGTTSTGVSINKLHHMIAASPSKSKIKVLQSIGRMLRLHESKEEAILYDIVDDLSFRTHKNFTLRHFFERLKIYAHEKFVYKIYNLGI